MVRPSTFNTGIRPLPEEDKQRYNLQQATLEEIFSTCDIITLHTPLNAETHHLITNDHLQLIRPGSLFINTARGAVVDQQALERQLMTGRFRAVLDVYDVEPPKADCPLYTLENVMMLPHMGGPTTDLRKFIARDLLAESAAFIDAGKPLQNEVPYSVAKSMSFH